LSVEPKIQNLVVFILSFFIPYIFSAANQVICFFYWVCLYDAVDALTAIGQKLGKKDWDFGIDPCSGEVNWKVVDGRKGFESTVLEK